MDALLKRLTDVQFVSVACNVGDVVGTDIKHFLVSSRVGVVWIKGAVNVKMDMSWTDLVVKPAGARKEKVAMTTTMMMAKSATMTRKENKAARQSKMENTENDGRTTQKLVK